MFIRTKRMSHAIFLYSLPLILLSAGCSRNESKRTNPSNENEVRAKTNKDDANSKKRRATAKQKNDKDGTFSLNQYKLNPQIFDGKSLSEKGEQFHQQRAENVNKINEIRKKAEAKGLLSFKAVANLNERIQKIASKYDHELSKNDSANTETEMSLTSHRSTGGEGEDDINAECKPLDCCSEEICPLKAELVTVEERIKFYEDRALNAAEAANALDTLLIENMRKQQEMIDRLQELIDSGISTDMAVDTYLSLGLFVLEVKFMGGKALGRGMCLNGRVGRTCSAITSPGKHIRVNYEIIRRALPGLHKNLQTRHYLFVPYKASQEAQDRDDELYQHIKNFIPAFGNLFEIEHDLRERVEDAQLVPVLFNNISTVDANIQALLQEYETARATERQEAERARSQAVIAELKKQQIQDLQNNCCDCAIGKGGRECVSTPEGDVVEECQLTSRETLGSDSVPEYKMVEIHQCAPDATCQQSDLNNGSAPQCFALFEEEEYDYSDDLDYLNEDDSGTAGEEYDYDEDYDASFEDTSGTAGEEYDYDEEYDASFEDTSGTAGEDEEYDYGEDYE